MWMELGQVERRFTFTEPQPFGLPGKHYSPEYKITSEPVYTVQPQEAQLSNLVTWTHLYATEGQAWPDHKTIIAPLIELSKRAPTQDDAEILKAGGSLKGLVALALSRPEQT